MTRRLILEDIVEDYPIEIEDAVFLSVSRALDKKCEGCECAQCRVYSRCLFFWDERLCARASHRPLNLNDMQLALVYFSQLKK